MFSDSLMLLGAKTTNLVGLPTPGDSLPEVPQMRFPGGIVLVVMTACVGRALREIHIRAYTGLEFWSLWQEIEDDTWRCINFAPIDCKVALPPQELEGEGYLPSRLVES